MASADFQYSMSPEQKQAAIACERRLGYKFKNRGILCEAITHASVANTRLSSYERLEFLGDSILGFVVCEYLFHEFPDWLEGDLTKVKRIVKLVGFVNCVDGFAQQPHVVNGASDFFVKVGVGVD